MNKKLQIIPTPYKVDFTGGEKFNIKKVCLLVENGAPLSRALELLCQKANFTFADSDSADLVLSFNTDDDFFNEKIAQEQGYIIKKENNVTYLYAKNLTGLAYGVTTLIQLIGKDIKTLNIYDKPDFKRRGNKWTVWAESGIWSYDFGDGKDAFISRIIRKLDMSLLYKINTIYFDGFGLNLDRFPEYCEVMKAVNDAAYNRGISLITGCYGMSYGQQGHGDSYQGKAYLNRKGYPDGETYSCIGYFDKTKVGEDATLEERIASVYAREHG